MRYIALLIICILSSCSFQYGYDVTLSVPEKHPFEKEEYRDFWYTLTVFDGERIYEMHVPSGTRKVKVRVKSGGLSVFALKPLGELGSLGGFYEPGMHGEVHMLPEYGSFADMLISAASYRPEAVRRLSMEAVMKNADNLQRVDESAFLEDVFNGTLGHGIKLTEKIAYSSDSIPSGVWVSERYDVPSFEVNFSSDIVHFLLYPGIYRFAEISKRILLSLIITEEGEVSMMLSELPLW